MTSKTIPVRLEIETHKEFSKRLIDDGISAQEFFRAKVEEYLKGKEKIAVIFDNGGGITLQLGTWAHWYDNPAQAAEDYDAYIADRDTTGWDGHEEEAAALVPTYDEMRNGGYRVYRGDEVEKEIAAEDPDNWGNIVDFCAGVSKIRHERK